MATGLSWFAISLTLRFGRCTMGSYFVAVSQILIGDVDSK